MGWFRLCVAMWAASILLITTLEGGAQSTDSGTLRQAAHQLFKAGKYRESTAIARRALRQAQKKHGPRASNLAPTLDLLARLYFVQGLTREGKRFAERSLAIRKDVFGQSHILTAETLNILGLLCHLEGRYVEGEIYAIQSLNIRENTLGLDHPDVARVLYTLSLIYSGQGRSIHSERAAGRALAIFEGAHGTNHPEVAKVLHLRAGFHFWQGDYAAAEVDYIRALKIRESMLGAKHPDVAETLNGLAALYWQWGKHRKAEDLFQSAISILELTFGPFHPYLAGTYNNLSGLYHDQGRYSDALEQMAQTLSIREKIQGPNHPDLESALSNIAVTYAAQGDWLSAFAYYRRATDIIVRRTRRVRHKIGRPRSGKIHSSALQKRETLVSFVSAAHRVASDKNMPTADYSAATFEIAQWALFSKAASTLAQMSARQATNDPRLADLVRERQDLVTKWQDIDADLTETRTQPSTARNTQREKILRAELLAIKKNILQIDERLNSDFKDYSAFANPVPLNISEVQKLLRSNEALVLFLDTSDETFVWVVTAEKQRWVRNSLGTNGLVREVSALRCGLDSAAWQDEGALACSDLLQVSLRDAPQHGRPLPFDQARAYQLYRELFGQVEDLIEGKDLLLVPTGPLTQLPLQVLVTAPADPSHKGANEFRKTTWLANKHAVTVLPSVASLKALRQFAKTSRATDPFIGFGNPLLVGPDGIDKRAWDRQSCQAIQASKPVKVATRAAPGNMSKYFRNGLADIASLRQQHPLPETADELCEVASLKNASEKSVYLGGKATERKIKSLSSDGSLAKAQIVHFATHGLLAGESEEILKARAEPGLILTPPDKATEDDDGLLTASEITLLKLDADWVILSACNTAGGGAEGAEALSGLARAFFYAGTRSLLVSHWAVYSDATVKLITGALIQMANNKGIGRSEALRRAMMDLLENGKPDEAHPSYWAPFILVGEGAPALSR